MKIIGWTSFDSECQGICINDKVLFEAVEETIRVISENGYIFSGEAHQQGYCCVPVFDNGKCLKCSMRGWAIIMSIAHTGDEKSYMNYYMNQFIAEEVKPEEEVLSDAFIIDHNDNRLLYYYTEMDLNLVAESVSNGMQLMTFDKVVMVLYDVISKYMENQNE